jgi:hypothetical protein
MRYSPTKRVPGTILSVIATAAIHRATIAAEGKPVLRNALIEEYACGAGELRSYSERAHRPDSATNRGRLADENAPSEGTRRTVERILT